MAKKKAAESAIRDFVQQSIRFAPGHLKWLTDEAERTGASFNALVRQLIDDSRTFYGLSPTMVEALDKDRARMKLDFHQYIQELLTRRYKELLRAEFSS